MRRGSVEIIAMTARELCAGSLAARREALARAGADGILLREKDLPEAAYEELARIGATVCRRWGAAFGIHSRPETARRLGVGWLHLSWSAFQRLKAGRRTELRRFARVGVSVHAVPEAAQAAAWGADYVLAGHVFATDSKSGLAGRGLEFLRRASAAAGIPVYAIGGVTADNIGATAASGASGVFLMSSLMRAAAPRKLIAALRAAAEQIPD
jgi:thiamine-phosphate pyrophosphorylase